MNKYVQLLFLRPIQWTTTFMYCFAYLSCNNRHEIYAFMADKMILKPFQKFHVLEIFHEMLHEIFSDHKFHENPHHCYLHLVGQPKIKVEIGILYFLEILDWDLMC